MSPQNILMIVVDCLRSDRIFGKNRTCLTPNIDKLAAGAVCVPNMYVENSTTAPAFGNIFTGTYSLYHGVTALLGVRMRSDMFTLADAFAANGYETHAELTGPMLPLLGMDQGFDEYNFRDQRNYYFTRWGDDLVDKFRQGHFNGPWFTMVHFWELHEPRQVPEAYQDEKFGATTYDQALSGLDEYIGRLVEAAGEDTVVVLTGDHGERVDEKTLPDTLLPYFMKKLDVTGRGENDSRMDEDIELLNLRGKELHEVSQELLENSKNNNGKIALFARLKMMLRLIRIGLTRFRIQKSRPGMAGFFENLKMKWNDLRLAGTVLKGRSEDAQMHLLRTTLSQFHLEHGFHVYDYLARVPFLISGSKKLPGPITALAEVRNIDILPTLCDLLELETPEVPWHGASFLKQIQTGETPKMRMYMEVRGGAQAVHAFYIRGVRAGQYKLAYGPNDDKAPRELYYLSADPGEKKNLVADNGELADQLYQEGQALAAAVESDQDQSQLSEQDQAATIEKLKSLGYM